MHDFLHIIRDSLSVGQRQTLQRFLSDAQAGRIPANAEAIRRSLDQIGQLLPLPEVDATTPEGFNEVMRALLANLAGVYQEIDQLESIQDTMADLNGVELDRIELALRDLQTVLDATRQANVQQVQYTDVFYETFGAEVRREISQEWHRPLPLLESSGQVESFLPLNIDPTDRSLKLAPGGDFLRSTTAQGEPLAQVRVEEILGLSIDPNHPINAAVDGRFYTYWRELILSEAPVQADRLQVPWLPNTYTAGAAARVHFRFPFAVPFTEVVLRPFARFPIEVLQVVWDNRKQAARNVTVDKNFTSGAAFWTSGAVAGAVLTFPAAGGYLNSRHANIQMTSGRVTLTNSKFVVTGTEQAYHFHYKIRRERTIAPTVLVNWYTGNGSVQLRADWNEPDTPTDEWHEFSHLYIAPSGAISGEVILVADGSGNVKYSDVVFAVTLGRKNLKEKLDLDSDSLVVQLDNATGTDIWLVVAQPHYEFLQVAVPEGDLDVQELWEEIRLQSESETEKLYRLQETPWRLEGGDPNPPRTILKEDGSTLLKEARRLGGRIRDMVVNLLKYAEPSPRTRSINRFMYVLGAWEIQIRHREYAPQGLFVSTPYKPRGEVREVVLLTNPPLQDLDGRIRFWITARASDKSDRAKLFTGRARFSSSTETIAITGDPHFFLPPVTRRDAFDGTDRTSRISLPQHPYVNREKIWTIHTSLSSGTLTAPLSYDPNKDVYYVNVGGTLTRILGYRPLKVTLEFDNGTVARPDTLGPVQIGDIGVAGPEILETATVEQEIKNFSNTELSQVGVRLTDTGNITARRPGLFGAARGNGAGTQEARSSQIVTLQALKTQYRNIVSGVNGVTLSLYWHNSSRDAASGFIVTRDDVLISPSKYTVNAEKGIIILRDSAPSGNTVYDKLVGYYHFNRNESGAREALDSRSVNTRPTSGVDFAAAFAQSVPVTRNVTDYLRGNVKGLRRLNMDDLSPDYYPVIEYLVDDRGRLVFAENLFKFGDTPARIVVEYESLEIEPRILVEYRKGSINEFSSKTPFLRDFTLFMNTRR